MTLGETASFFLPVALYAIGACLALVFGRHGLGLWGGHLAAALGGLAGLAVSLRCLLSTEVDLLVLGAPVPFATLSFRLDALSAFFLLLISLVAMAAALYAPGYIAHGHGSARGLGVALNGFLAAMVLVVLADSVLAFMLAWEAMALASFFLVVEDHHQAEARRAGLVYLVMTHVGGAFLLGAFLLLFAHAGSLNFDAMRHAAPTLPAMMRDLAFLAALVGFGTKAGLIPLHVWLPRAHPAAPSYASALMSGVMIKLAVYGLLRVGWGLAGPGPAWWGGLVVAVGIVSAVLGVLYALAEHDLKRLLAFSSVENIGIVFVGVGAGLLLAALGQPALAAFALAAGLLHALNHAAFKGLLFLGAGAVLQAVHTRNLERMGGLIHRMPWTAGAFLVGAAAISAVPPLNGFASEWMTFQALLLLGGQSAPVAIGGALAAALLALTGGLALFCFVKAFGVAFLGVARDPAASAAHEVSLPMRAGMVLLAASCVALGLVPSAALRVLDPVTGLLLGAAIPARGEVALSAPPNASGLYAPMLVLLALIGLGWVAWALGRALGGRVGVRIAPPWVCGMALEPRMQYSAAALAKPIRIIFRALLRPYREVEQQHDASPHFVSGVRFEAGLEPVYEIHLYQRALGVLLRGAHLVRTLQNGSLRTYLAYMFATLIVALLIAR
ncbi:MAG: hydrogenase 4 subunit B [Chloroflexi bacterium]|nr:hydrogenase 4 subunit B [Chloroflexota bacterium]